MALADRVSTTVDRASFDDLVTLVTQAPPWEKDRLPGGRMLLQAIEQGEARRTGPDPRPLTWRLARAPRARRRIARPARSSQRRSACWALAELSSHRHEENAAKLVAAAPAAPARGCGAARVGRRLHAALDKAARRCPRGSGHGSRRGRRSWPRISRAEASRRSRRRRRPRSAAQEQRLRRTAPTRHRPPEPKPFRRRRPPPRKPPREGLAERCSSPARRRRARAGCRAPHGRPARRGVRGGRG